MITPLEILRWISIGFFGGLGFLIVSFLWNTVRDLIIRLFAKKNKPAA